MNGTLLSTVTMVPFPSCHWLSNCFQTSRTPAGAKTVHQSTKEYQEESSYVNAITRDTIIASTNKQRYRITFKYLTHVNTELTH